MTFQFQKVRFKVKRQQRTKHKYWVSIPKGAIQRSIQNRKVDSLNQVSIPKGAIQSNRTICDAVGTGSFNSKRCDSKKQKEVEPPSAICFNSKRCDSKKDGHSLDYFVKTVSIPKGAIQRMCKTLIIFVLQVFQFQKVRFKAASMENAARPKPRFNSKRCDSKTHAA